MELLKQVRVAFIGIPDVGKSTLIKSIIKYLYNKELSVDTLMNEVHYSDNKDIYDNDDTRTIKAAKILCPFKDYELMLIDCPGHLEYSEQIQQGLNLASIIVCLQDENRLQESKMYINNILDSICIKDKYILYLNTHSKINSSYSFEANLKNNDIPIKYLLDNIDKCNYYKIDIEQEAKQIIQSIFANFNKKTLMFSGGKDSIVGHHLCNNVDVIWPKSGFDFIELEDFIKHNYIVKPMRNIPYKMDYQNSSVFEIHKAKGNFNNDLEQSTDLLIINYRASDEGVRSKDHYIKFGKYCHRFSPVFYFSEENIWRYIKKYNLKFPSIYYKGYRSLGDEPVTVPSMPECNSIDTIITYIHNHPFEERNGRIGQDNAVDFGMEKLRNNGFF